MMKMDPHEAEALAKGVQGLQPRIIQGMQAQFEAASYPGSNDSGLQPYGENVLVKMDACAVVRSSGLVLTDEIVDRQNEASVTGCIYAMGPDAFPGDQHAPAVGQRIYIEKYAGVKAVGIDGALYRVIPYIAIACGIMDDAERVEG